MATDFFDPIDLYNTAARSAWHDTIVGTSSEVLISAGNGRGGGNSLRFTKGGNHRIYTADALTVGATKCIHLALKIDGYNTEQPSILLEVLDSATTQLFLYITTAGQLAVYRNTTLLATSSYILPLSSHVHLAWLFTIHPSTGSFTVYANGGSVLTASGQNTRNSANSQVTNFRVGKSSAGSSAEPVRTYDVTDLVVADAFAGDIKLIKLAPDGAGNYTDFSLTGAGANYQAVDEAPANDDTDYVSSATVGQRDSYTLANLPAGALPKFVGAAHYAKKTDAGTRTFKPGLRISSTNYLGDEKFPSTSYRGYKHVWDQNPNTSAAWAEAGVNSTELLAEVIS